MTEQPRAESQQLRGDLPAILRQARMDAFLKPSDQETRTSSGSDDLQSLVERTATIYANSVTDETRITYARRWRLFESWCQAHDFLPLPANAETVMLYIAATITEDGAALSTIRGRLAAINRVHREAGHQAPGEDPAMGLFLRGLSRTHPPRVQTKEISALRISDLRSVCRHLDSLMINPIAARDAAVLVLHKFGIGDGEMSRLTWRDITVSENFVVVQVDAIRTGWPDRSVVVCRSADGPAVDEMLQAWRAIASEVPSPVFTHIDSTGWREDRSLTSRAIFKIRKSRLEALGSAGQKATVDQAIELLVGEPSDVLRDKALLLVGFAGAFRRNEVTRLTWGDIREADGGLIVHLLRSKTDLSGRGRDVGIPSGKSDLTCPVLAYRRWRDRCTQQLRENPAPDRRVFTHVGRSGRITDEPLSPEGLTRVVQRRAHQSTISGHWGGRSLRAGFISTAADLEIPLESIARQSRHKTLDSLIRYIRNEPFRKNSAAQVGL